MRRPLRPTLLSLSTLALALAACGKPKPIALGEDRTLAPQLAIVDSQRPPRDLTVTLGEPAHVVVLAVFPGRGATLVYPIDTAVASAQLAAGQHRLRVDSTRAPAQPDSTFLRAGGVRPRATADSGIAARDPSRPREPVTASERERQRDRERMLAMLAGPDQAHFMVFAARAPIDHATLARRMRGVTIPIGTEEALSTVAKMVRAATTTNRWAATAQLVDLR